MRKKILWISLSFLLVAALVLTGCPAPEEPVVEEPVVEEPVLPVVEEPVTEEPVVPVEPVVGEPQYGGDLTAVLMVSYKGDPEAPDPLMGGGMTYLWTVEEKPIIGDFEKYGPRGTGEYDFTMWGFIPEAFLGGHLIESWEVSPEKIVWNVRPGVYWAADNVDYMENRELTAEDVVADLIVYRDSAVGEKLKSYIADIYATDRYTLVIEFTEYSVKWICDLGYYYHAVITPPEMMTAGGENWENHVGTGPFIFDEYVIGSHVAVKRNPNYWGTATINGKEYQLPFIDEMKFPIIPDLTTQVAALRSGVVDLHQRVWPQHFRTADNISPEILSGPAAGSSGEIMALKTTEPPFDDVEVRRALMIGTDMQVFVDFLDVGPLNIHWWPMFQGDPTVYTPLEKLPPNIRVLYDYNPELARQMIIDAGYPDGFTMSFYTQARPLDLDRAAMFEDMWAKIGVTVNIEGVDPVTWATLKGNKLYTDAIQMGIEVADPTRFPLEAGVSRHYTNTALWENERFSELAAKAFMEIDITERNRLCREASLIMMEEVPYLPYQSSPYRQYWWPWIKNFYGESAVGSYDVGTVLARAWIDQTMKEDMGYR